jgi:endonuclease/exonuclease/phosphatase family metal-dependent hydrolase
MVEGRVRKRPPRLWYIVAILAAIGTAYVLNRPDTGRVSLVPERGIDQFSPPGIADDIGADAIPGRVRIATWNVRMLSDRSRDASEVAKIASMIGQFDLVALQEVHDTRVLDRIRSKLDGWSYLVSRSVGTESHTERYAYFYRSAFVTPIGDAAIVRDPDNVLIREPFVASFRTGEFDFTLCTIHILYGNSIPARRRELRLMDELVAAVQKANGAEADVILLGDFNFPPDDNGWQLEGWMPLVNPPTKTTIGDRSLYDNIWIHPDATSEYAQVYGVVEFDRSYYADDLDRASLEMSDHRPVWAQFSTATDDDSDEYGDLSQAKIRLTPLP